MKELEIIQKFYDLIKWYIPILNRLPQSYKFTLGERITTGLYDFLEALVTAQYSQEKINLLEGLNGKLNIIRYQTRLLLDFGLMSIKRHEYISKLLEEIGSDLGGWIKHQKRNRVNP